MKKENKKEEVHVVSHFKAPVDVVFDAFSTAEALNAWWGPVETKNSTISLDFRTGGTFFYKMEGSEQVNYARFLFHRIERPTLLEFTNAFTDKSGNVIKPPFDLNIPREIFYRLAFSESKGRTTITLRGWAVNASEEERETLVAISQNVAEGFGATFGELEKYLEIK